MAPHFVNCNGCSRHFNTSVKEDFVCCLCKAIDACVSDIERDVFKVCDLREPTFFTDSFKGIGTMPDMWKLF